MATSFLSGDILHAVGARSGPRALAFGADCSGSMHVGISVALAKRWPAFAAAFEAHARDGKVQVGDLYAWRDGELSIYALCLQKDSAKPKFSAFERALGAALKRAAFDGVRAVYLPRLASGASGLDWTRVKRHLTEIDGGDGAQLFVFEKFVRHVEPAREPAVEPPVEPE